MSIGTNPTVNGDSLTIEVHFFDFNADLYDQKIEVSILHYLRDEQKFGSVEILKSAIANDQRTALEFLQNRL